MYVIRCLKTNQYFCYKHKQIIEFNNVEEANAFLQEFIQYSMTRAMNEEPELVFQVMKTINSFKIEEKLKNMDTINFDILKRDR